MLRKLWSELRVLFRSKHPITCDCANCANRGICHG